MGKKFKMPTAPEFYKKKKMYWRKRNLVWDYLEREMRANAEVKPYNEKVGEWLKFLKDLRYYFFCEGRRKYRRLQREVGPPWYMELSTMQREVLDNLKHEIHQDLLEDLPLRIRKSLSDLGLTYRVPDAILMQTMAESFEDPGVFIWNLYTALYKAPPSQLQKTYDMNARILMSALVCIDMVECVQNLNRITQKYTVPPEPTKKKIHKTEIPDVRYGEYLQKMHIPCFMPKQGGKKKRAEPLVCKIKLRSEESYEKLCQDHTFLDRRKERNIKEKQKERICNYKFWEPPTNLRNTDPKMAAYVAKLKMFKEKARARHLKFKAPYDNVQYHIGTVTYVGDHPRFMLNAIVTLPSGYIPIHGGYVSLNKEFITNIAGYWRYPRYFQERCYYCDCVIKWESTVMNFLEQSKCRCGHHYDFYNEGKLKEIYFHPPTKYGSHFLDKAKIYQLDPTEDYIKDAVKEAMRSQDTTPEPSLPPVSALNLEEKELLAAFLSDLADTPLMIPHLPKANLLNNLQEWVRRRVKNAIKPNHKLWTLQSQRRWLDLKHIDFRARSYFIPFLQKELEGMNWSQRNMMQKLFEAMLNDFVTRNRTKIIEQTRLWWPTMKYDAYPNKAFLEVFFTYMPSRMKDIFLINPYSPRTLPKKIHVMIGELGAGMDLTTYLSSKDEKEGYINMAYKTGTCYVSELTVAVILFNL